MISITGTLDIECAGWSYPVVAVANHAVHGPHIIWDRDGDLPDKLTDHLMEHRGQWATHAGGTYDILPIAESMRRRGIRCAIYQSGARISRLVGGGITLLDSWLLAPMSLDRIAEISGDSAPRDLGWECRCRERCGGYCQIRPRMTDRRRRQLEEYCVRDTQVHMRALAALTEHARSHQIQIRGTIGGTAWQTASKRLKIPPAALPAKVWTRCHDAYYGGRLAIGQTHSLLGDIYDLVGAYGSALAHTALPVGPWTECGGSDAGHHCRRGRPGIYRCTVRVPEMQFPPLPVRYSGRTGYPHGLVSGSWTSIELASAEFHGCAIQGFHGAIIWETSDVLFDDLISDWYRIRNDCGRDSALGEWYGGLGRALTGKLAESPDREFVRIHPPSIRVCYGKPPCTRAKCSGACGAYRQIDQWGMIWAVPFFRLTDASHVPWAAYLTSANRIRWLAGANRAGESFVYGDTDSIFSDSESPCTEHEIGNRLGQWRHVGIYGDFECLAPKVYRYMTTDGEETIRASGIKGITADEWRNLRDARGRQTPTIKRKRGVLTFREAASTGSGALFRRKAQSWRVGRDPEGVWYGDRYLDAERAITYPGSHEQLMERFTWRARK